MPDCTPTNNSASPSLFRSISRGSINVNRDITKDDLIAEAKKQENVILHLAESKIIKEIVVPQKLVNFVIK